MSELSEDQKKKIIEALEKAKALLPCPRCGNQNFSLVGGYFNQPIQTELGGLVIGGPEHSLCGRGLQPLRLHGSACSRFHRGSTAPTQTRRGRAKMTDASQDRTSEISSALTNRIAQDTKVHLNLGQDAIVTTEDKVRLVLMTHLERLEQRKAWIAPAGVFIAILIAFVTADFKDFLLKAAVWEAVFLVAGVLSLCWLVLAVVRAFKTPTVQDIVGELKKSSSAQ